MKQYDAIIVGSGAGGGMAAYILSNAGLKVCLIEAGPMYDPAIHVTQLKNAWDSPRRGASMIAFFAFIIKPEKGIFLYNTFIFETTCLWAFGTAWLVKGSAALKEIPVARNIVKSIR